MDGTPENAAPVHEDKTRGTIISLETLEGVEATDVDGGHAVFGSADTYTYGHPGEDILDGNVDGTHKTVNGATKNGAILPRFIITIALTDETNIVPNAACLSKEKSKVRDGVETPGANSEGLPTNLKKKGV